MAPRQRKQIVETKTLFHSKWFDPECERRGRESIFGEVAGQSIRVTMRTYDDGTIGIFGDVSELTFRQRLSGKSYCYWRSAARASMRRTSRSDLVLLKTMIFDRKSGGAESHYVFDHHRPDEMVHFLLGFYTTDFLPSDPGQRRRRVSRVDPDSPRIRPSRSMRPGPSAHPDPATAEVIIGADDRTKFRADVTALGKLIPRLLGGYPSAAERIPNYGAMGFKDMELNSLIPFFVDAADWHKVTRRAFSTSHTTDELVAAVERIGGASLRWYRSFRGLVPTEKIAESMNRAADAGKPIGARLNERLLRTVLRQIPRTGLERILADPTHQAVEQFDRALAQVNNHGNVSRDVSAISRVLAENGEDFIKDARDIRPLVQKLPKIDDPTERNQRVSKRSMIVAEIHDMERNAEEYLQEYNDLAERAGRATLSMDDWKDPAVRREAVRWSHQAAEEVERAEKEKAERERAERQRREERERRQREDELRRWRDSQYTALHELVIGDYTVLLSDDEDEIIAWGEQMSNFFTESPAGGGGRTLGGAVVDADDTMVLNFILHQDSGLWRLQGEHSADARHAIGATDAQMILDGLIEAGIEVNRGFRKTKGIYGLIAPEDQHHDE